MVKLSILDSCIKCGHCVSVCPTHILTQKKPKNAIDIVKLNSCISCGHCVAICPTGAVNHSSFPENKVHPINQPLVAGPDAVMELLRARRSNRSFQNKPVPNDLLDQILEAAHFAPTSGNSQTLQYTLITQPETIALIAQNTIIVVNSLIKKLNNPLVHAFLKITKSPVLQNLPYLSHLSDSYKNGNDVILRGAKALIFIHGYKKRFGLADANLAYQNASIMAESLGVGHFYTGFVNAFSMEDKAGIIKKTIGISGQELYAGMALGMPQFQFKKYIERNPQVINRII